LLEGLLLDCQKTGVEIRLNTTIHGVAHEPDRGVFVLETTGGKIYAESLVVATGGLSIPTMGSSPFAYQLAKQFSIPVRPVRAGLVPLTWSPVDLSRFQVLAGVSMTAKLETEEMSFLDDILFTHRGLSGPAALQISSYWKAGKLVINWLPGCYLPDVLSKSKREDGRFTLKKWLSLRLPNRLIPILINEEFANCRLADLTKDEIMKLESLLHAHVVKPSGTEGYRTAEVTLGGVDTDYLSSQTLQVKTLPSLYFIGEAVDVTGWLGGYNFQWAWSSGWVAGQYC
jgi:predicted Rossmann fold flavoprotein